MEDRQGRWSSRKKGEEERPAGDATGAARKKRPNHAEERKPFVEMRSQEVSAQTGKPYPMRLVLSVASLSSAAWFGKRPGQTSKKRPGPKPLISDEALLEAIRQDLSQS